MSLRRIFLDLDDVLNRCNMTALRAIGCDVDPMRYDDWPVGVDYDIGEAATKLLGREVPGHGEFWNQGCLTTVDFWNDLPLSPESGWLFHACVNAVGARNVCLLTKPTEHGGCFIGKRRWKRHYLSNVSMLMGEDKYQCASPDTLLIDDNEDNCRTFMSAGGQALLLPRPWNCLRDYCHPVRGACDYLPTTLFTYTRSVYA